MRLLKRLLIRETAYAAKYTVDVMSAVWIDLARWAKQLGGPDAWNAACLFKNNNESCPDINA
jgi:hypothetical protein